MKQSHLILLVLIVVLCIAGWYTYRVISDNRTLGEDSDISQSFSANGPSDYTNLSGDPISVESYSGNVIVVNSWATWSPQSRDQLVELSRMARDYNNQPVTFMAINRSEPDVTAQAYLRSIDLHDSLEIVLDNGDAFYQNIEAYAMPMTIVYGTDGQIVYEVNGVFTNEQLRSAIDSELNL